MSAWSDSVAAAGLDVDRSFPDATRSAPDIRIVHVPADARLGRDLVAGLCSFSPAAAAIDVRAALTDSPQPTTVYNVAARLAMAWQAGPAGSRLVLVGLGRVGGAIAQALAAELLGQNKSVENVLLLDCAARLGVGADRAEAMERLSWSEPMVVWNLREDKRRVKSFTADDLSVGIQWIFERTREMATENPVTLEPPTLLTLRTSKSDAGYVYCIPGAGASVVSFLDIVMAAPEDLAIYGLQPRGLDGICTPYSTVQAAAAAMELLIIEQNHGRPIHLVGHSFGGCVAFELACRLQQRGRPPASLSLIDTRPPRNSQWTSDVNDISIALSWVRLNEQAIERSMGIDETDLKRGDLLHNLAVLHHGMVRAGLLPANTQPSVLLGPMRMFSACVRSWYYTTTVYREPMRLIYLDDPFVDLAGNAQISATSRAAWSALAPKFEFRHGSGNHITGLKMPHASRLSDLLGWKGEAC